MIYYQTKKLLIKYNPETKIARIKNNIGIENSIISNEEFVTLIKFPIKKQKYRELMNLYFKNTKDKWVYEGVNYRKLENFEVGKDVYNCTNYNFDELPKHDVAESRWLKDMLLVYHQGKVYYFTWSYNGESRGQLMDTKTFEYVKWTSPKNCAPIFNIDEKRII